MQLKVFSNKQQKLYRVTFNWTRGTYGYRDMGVDVEPEALFVSDVVGQEDDMHDLIFNYLKISSMFYNTATVNITFDTVERLSGKMVFDDLRSFLLLESKKPNFMGDTVVNLAEVVDKVNAFFDTHPQHTYHYIERQPQLMDNLSKLNININNNKYK